MKPFVVAGGDAAGLSAASKCKRADPDREVIVFEKGEWVSYAHCGSPYYVKGEVDGLTDLVSLSPADVANRGIDLRRGHEVTGVTEESVTVAGPDGEFEQPYGDLLLATGAHAVQGPFDGLDRRGAFTLHGLPDAAAMRAFVDPEFDPETADIGPIDAARLRPLADLPTPETAAIVGGGYVGVELAEALSARGIEVHLFQRNEHLLPPFGAAVGEAVRAELASEGVVVHTDTAVDSIAGGDRVDRVEHADGILDTEMAVVGVGIRPNTGLAEDAGATLGDSGAVAVDRYGRTDVDDVYAAGDCAEARHTVTGEPTWVPLGLTANRAGRAIGATVGGEPTPVGDVAGTAVVKAFEVGAGRAGFVGDASARAAGFEPVTETITAGSRSGYYPGAAETTVTLTADRGTGRVLGGSVVGTDRAAKRIDTLATALDAGHTVAELERLDLAYAPPFSPVWDPILVAAKVLAGRLE